METLKTFDYSIFKEINSNREVDDKHVNKLVRAIRKKNLLHINPIICNKDHEVIDGQHRLEAVKQIGGIYIYYVIDDQVSKGDIALINSNSKNWNIMDYINYWTIEKRPGFDKLSSFLASNPMIAPGTALTMMSAVGIRDLEGVKNGSVDVSNINYAVKVANVVREFRNRFEYAYDRNFIRAVSIVINAEGYDHELMKQKVEGQPRSLVKCISTKQYIEMLEEIYNYRSQKTRLEFPKK